MTIHDVIGYRREAEQHVGSDENLYRFEWVCFISMCTTGVSCVTKFIVRQQDGRLKVLRMQLIGDEDASVDEDEGGIGRWREYVASYVTRHPTEWISTSDGKKMSGGEPFLSRYVAVTGLQAARILKAIIRNVASRDEEGVRIESSGDLGVRIVGGKYKMLYEAGTEHTLRRVVGGAEGAQLEHKARQRREERKQSRWLV